MEENKKFYIVYQINNKINNNIYIGAHITENLNDGYFGSGSNIKKAVKEFGKENFEKIILYNLDNKEEMLEKEKELVNDEFIKCGDTYNIILGGGGFNTKNLVSVKDNSGNTFSTHKTDPRYLSGELVGVTKGLIIVRDKNYNTYQVFSDDSRYLSGEFVGYTKNLVMVKDKNNNTFQVSINDPRYLSGQLIHISTGLVTVKDKNNNIFRVSVNDPKYLSGEFIYIGLGRKHKNETKLKMKQIMIGKGKGIENSQYNTCWIYNENLKENKKIKKEDLDNWLKTGWIKGRKIKF
jgi:hypothetical protein